MKEIAISPAARRDFARSYASMAPSARARFAQTNPREFERVRNAYRERIAELGAAANAAKTLTERKRVLDEMIALQQQRLAEAVAADGEGPEAA